MKATDLMIGDYVRYIGTEAFGDMRKGDIVKVAALQGNYICLGYLWARGDMLEPIALTEKILEKNGFKHYAENMYENYELSEDYYSIEAKEVNDGLWRIKVEHEEIFNDTEICSVSYIHQLQQFFRLCGIEKEIAL